jgi:hypothetical protein
MLSENIYNIALEFDEAIDSKNIENVQNLFDTHSQNIKQMEDSYDKPYYCYIIGNLCSSLRSLTNDENSIWKLEQKWLFKEIYYFRKSINSVYFENLDPNYKLQVYTNLGNSFNHYGRTINAIKYYDKALDIYDKFDMALLNKANTLETFYKINFTKNSQVLILKYAYEFYEKSIDAFDKRLSKPNSDNDYYQNLKEKAINNKENIEKLINDIEYTELGDYEPEDIEEKEYRKWALNNKLFLNPINDLLNHSYANEDNLLLSPITTNIGSGFPIYFTYLNQLKQEYISYRYLLYQGLNEKVNSFYDKDISLYDDCDFNIYNVNIENIKIAFRGFYSIFDKIAYFMNKYFELQLQENQIDFRKVWYKKQEINEKFDNSHNLPLRGLYLISKDIYFNNKDEDSKDFVEVLEPEASNINKIRNHLEHKFISIKELEYTDSYREVAYSITIDELTNKTIHLAQIAREAIMYLTYSIYIEEQKEYQEDSYILENSIDIQNK